MRIAEELPREDAARSKRVAELLGVMLSRKQSERPFLIVTDVETSRFVQFAGSEQEELLLDVPVFSYSKRYPGVRTGRDLETVVAQGFQFLRRQLLRRQVHPRWMVDLQWTGQEVEN